MVTALVLSLSAAVASLCGCPSRETLTARFGHSPPLQPTVARPTRTGHLKPLTPGLGPPTYPRLPDLSKGDRMNGSSASVDEVLDVLGAEQSVLPPHARAHPSTVTRPRAKPPTPSPQAQIRRPRQAQGVCAPRYSVERARGECLFVWARLLGRAIRSSPWRWGKGGGTGG